MTISSPNAAYRGAAKTLFRGAASTGSTTLYTVPTGTTTYVLEMLITNTTAGALTYTINLNSVAIASGTTVNANSTNQLIISEPLTAGQTITALASSTSVNFHIAGLEVA